MCLELSFYVIYLFMQSIYLWLWALPAVFCLTRYLDNTLNWGNLGSNYVLYAWGNYENRHISWRNIWSLNVLIKKKNCSSVFHIVEQKYNQGETKYIHTCISYTCMHIYVCVSVYVCVTENTKGQYVFFVRVLYMLFQNYSTKNRFYHLPLHLLNLSE